MTSLRRIAAMPPEELRCRLERGLRNAAARLRWTIAGSAWHRPALASALSRDPARLPSSRTVRTALRARDDRAAHRDLAAHFAARSSPFPVNARDVSTLSRAIHAAVPAAAADAVERADAMIAGRFTLLGYRDIVFGVRPDWHTDPVHGRRAPRRYWSRVPFLDPAFGDHKIVWELNRHQYWLALGRARALTGERRFYTAFTSHLVSWLESNPPLTGTNWASMLELGLRAISWLWALELFAAQASEADETPWIVDLLLAIDRQLTHIEQNLSRYFSPNTHLTGEALALYVAGLSLPELDASGRRAAVGRDVLVEQASRQIRSDGGHAELSTHYQRYSTDFYLLALTVARRAGDRAATVFEDAARLQAQYLRTICDDQGIRPAIGDDDGGQLFPICGRPADDCRDTLWNAAILLDEPALAIGPVPEESYWLAGTAAAGRGPSHASWRSAALPASGYYVSRTARGDHLVFDAGPHGFLNGGHAHADALAVTLSVTGTPLLIDPGTATYTMDAGLRDRLRTTMMHNALVLDGRSQSQPKGAFHWSSRTNAEAPLWRSSSDCDYVEGTHTGYAPAVHTRAILAVHGLGWWILDHLPGPGVTGTVETYWHLHPSWSCDLEGPHVCRIRRGETVLALASAAPLTLLHPGQHDLAVHSPAYGIVQPAPVLRGGLVTPIPSTIGAFIPATSALARGLGIEELRVETEPGETWHAAAFRVRWNAGAMTLLCAVEESGRAASESSAPLQRWGTAELQTDARLALLIDYATAASEAVLVNGSFLSERGQRQIVSLSRRVPLLRLTTAHVAPGVHEVAVG
jgi:hypothetical protein